jgi:LPXTG-site transpeptidase (sortase) family protein
LIACSAAVLAFGLLSIISALGDDPADLPSEGSIEQILEDNQTPQSVGDVPPEPTPLGPLPVRLAVPAVYLDAPVQTFGVNEANIPQVPDRADLVAWYDFSARPGHGNAVFSGHVDWEARNGDPIAGVFYRLRELKLGDTIFVKLDDGTEAQYRVIGNVAAPYDDPSVVQVMGPAGRDVITLITCGGTWEVDPSRPLGGNYTHRVIVRAERVHAAAVAVGGN